MPSEPALLTNTIMQWMAEIPITLPLTLTAIALLVHPLLLLLSYLLLPLHPLLMIFPALSYCMHLNIVSKSQAYLPIAQAGQIQRTCTMYKIFQCINAYFA
jgi:hypothetical protein